MWRRRKENNNEESDWIFNKHCVKCENRNAVNVEKYVIRSDGVSSPPCSSLWTLSGWHEFPQHYCSAWYAQKSKLNCMNIEHINKYSYRSPPPKKKWCWYPFLFCRKDWLSHSQCDAHCSDCNLSTRLVWYQYPNQINFEKVSRCIKAAVQIRVWPSIFLFFVVQLNLFE